MSPKIEKVWGSVFGSFAVKRKDSADKDNPAKKEDHRQERQQKDGEGEPKQADRHDVEKAMADLRTTSQFTQNGLKVELLETKDGLNVKMTHANGSTIKVMTAEEFLKLRDGSTAAQPRGKILDQKF